MCSTITLYELPKPMKHLICPVYHPRRVTQQGFTLIEMAIVLLIVGLLVGPLFQLYSNYLTQQKMQTTKDHVNQAMSAMAVSDPRYAPCPSDRSLPPNDPNFGAEQCDMTVIPNCNPGGIPAQGICQTAGSRDADGDGAIDRVIIGGIPRIMVDQVTGARTTILSGDAALDGWGQWLNYAVSQKVRDHTNTDGSNNFRFGVINAIDENGRPTAGVTAPGDSEFVVWSSGKNGAGAYNYNGVLMAPCPALVAAGPPINPRESENCNNNFTFMQGIGNYEGANAATYLDDYVRFYFQTAGDLWAFAMRNNAPTQHIYNLNTGNVGINTAAPVNQLDVSGPNGTPGNLEATAVRINTLQTTSGEGTATLNLTTTAFPPTGICGTSGSVSQIVTGWDARGAGGKLCGGATVQTPAMTIDCHALFGNTFWINGLNTEGCVTCSDGIVERDVKDAAGTPCVP